LVLLTTALKYPLDRTIAEGSSLGYRNRGLITICFFLIIFVFAGAVCAVPILHLDFYKDNGYGLGDDMQGQWTINAAVSSDIVRVEFYLDNQLQKNVTSAPFSWSFDTANYTEAKHMFKVVAYDSAGVTAETEKQSNFVGVPVTFVAGIIGLIVSVTVVVLVVCVHRIRKHDAKKLQT
jgi:hypothetical protein